MPEGTRVVKVNLGARSYEIRIGPGLIREVGRIVAGVARGRRILIVTDRHVGPKYGHALAASLRDAGMEGAAVEIPPGEGAKSLKIASFLYDQCIETGLDRRSTIVALGGGVIGDVAGFVAATFMRGIDYVQVPTTLLAQVDSSVGGKTAIDHPKAKNAIGAFHQPRAVVADVRALETLPERELKAGIAEVIKYGVIADADFFAFLESNMAALLARREDVLTGAIARSCEIKASVVEADERESGPREALNFGHTFGHAIETATGYGKYLHGEAVAIGMAMAGRLAADRGLWAADDASRLEKLIVAAGLPVRASGVDPAAVREAMFRDKKARDGRLRLVLPVGMGRVRTFDDIPEDAVGRILAAGCES
ncbi:MAG: 3-dehydroquinate synthase [Planctomycetota bacterium]|nr:3-dehydroquinate synthase [Planctomycetota bacterium]